MRAVLVFTPCANPSYMPLGIASLAEYVNHTHPEYHVFPLDLNIATWNRLADGCAETAAMRDFMQGRREGFFDRKVYNEYQRQWKTAAAGIDTRQAEAKCYLETDALSEPLVDLLEFYKEQILEKGPGLVGFSIMYPRQVIFSLAMAKYLSETMKERPRIVAGGATVSGLRADEILRACPYVDAVFGGEGEEGLASLYGGRPFAEIPGLIYREGERVRVNRKPDTLSLAKLPLPMFEGYDFTAYFNPEPVVPVVFSRGCRWRKCRFCAHNFSYSGYRRRSFEDFADYLARMRTGRGVRHFYFADQYIDAEDLNLLAEAILARGLDIRFHVMGRPTENYTAEIFQTLFRAGCVWISWGIESGSQRLLDLAGKGTSVATVRRLLSEAHAAGISNLPMMIFGLPMSQDQDFAETMDLLEETWDAVDDITASSFVLFEKTLFASQAAKFGLAVTERERLFENARGAVHSMRLIHKEHSSSETLRPPRGPLEAAQWNRRKQRLGEKCTFEDLSCEHYLLYAAHLKHGSADTPQVSGESLSGI